MSGKNFIRLNINDEYLSFGNFFRIIKEESDNRNSFLQSELFEILFDTEDIADSTVNNYCTGLRAINPKYKKYFKEIENNYKKNKNILITKIGKIIALIEKSKLDVETITLNQINENKRLNNICNRLYSISKNDSYVSIKITNELYNKLEESNLYEFIVQVLFYIILEKKQPIYEHRRISPKYN